MSGAAETERPFGNEAPIVAVGTAAPDAACARVAPEWIAVDWGTSNLRATAMTAEGPVGALESGDGMGTLAPGGFERALVSLIDPWLPARGRISVLACGMVGARQGWVEAGYRAVPCAPLEAGSLTRVRVEDARIDVAIAPGLSQSQPADVMRGEETQIAGVLAAEPGLDGTLCLPGTHTKWVHVSAGEVVSFRTCLTGEMFALLSRQSVLRHGLEGGDWDDTAFDAAVADALSQPGMLPARLFSLRAEGLLHGLPPGAARARLSGLLIGLDLAASRPYWLGRDVTVVGAPGLSAHYARALAAQGVTARLRPAGACTLAGLASLRAAA